MAFRRRGRRPMGRGRGRVRRRFGGSRRVNRGRSGRGARPLRVGIRM